MSARQPLHFAIIACAALALPAAHADTVLLDNGDRLSGKVLHMDGNTLTLQTDYADTLKIRWSRVRSLEADRPLRVLRQGARVPEPARKLGGAEFPVDRIAYLNPTPDESGLGVSYKGRFNLSAARTTGNSSTARAYADGDFTARAKQYRYNLMGKVRQESDTGTTTASSWLFGGNRDRFLDERRFLYLRASFEHDRFKDVDLRTTAGGGAGLQLIDSEISKLSVRGGLDAVSVDRIAGMNERYPALGWGVSYSRWVWDKAFELFHEQEGFWNLQDRSQVTLRSRTGVRVPVAHGLSANAQVNVDWEREPAPGRKPTDATLLFGVGYDW